MGTRATLRARVAEDSAVTLAGWILMGCSVGFVLALTAFCFYRVMRTPEPKEHMHAPLDIDTHERQE
jgi:hypothetical protein